MSQRWKHQIKAGLPFGILMPIFLTALEGYYSTYQEAFCSIKLLYRLLVFLPIGVFVIGYSSWRERFKNEQYNKQK